ncbi:MAG: hypothetical protein QOJ39_1755 [Candidatus Eremiobacteraeota bacterium]|nr:hypothetical protein [Candidatus Eremiobacteraeota bacterium]
MITTRSAFAALLIAVLAGCSGGSHSVPAASRAADGLQNSTAGSRSPSGIRASGTLYYADTSNAYALPLNAKGASTATRTITPHPENQGINTALATNVDGTLDVLHNYFDGTGEHCRVTVEPADANGSPTATDVPCDTAPSTQGDGVARNDFNGFDILYNTPNTFIVKRFADDGASSKRTLTLGPPGFAGLYLGTDPGGHDYLVNSGGEIREYTRHETNVDAQIADCTVSAFYGDGPLTVARDKTIYLMVRGGDTLANSSIEAITACGTSGPATVSRTIGPFPDSYISAMAVDDQGALYVGLNSLDGASPSTIAVFDKTANGAPSPKRVIAPSPATNFIRGLATWEPPATPAPSPTPSPAPSATP